MRILAVVFLLASSPAQACQLATLFELTYQSERLKDYRINTFSREAEGAACRKMRDDVREKQSIQGARDQFIVYVECVPCAIVNRNRQAYAKRIEAMRQNVHKMMGDILK